LPICAHALVGAGATTTTAVTPGNEISTRELMSPGAVCARTIVVHRTIDLHLISHQFQVFNLHASTVAAKVVQCQARALGVTFGDRPVYLGVGPAVGEPGHGCTCSVLTRNRTGACRINGSGSRMVRIWSRWTLTTR